MGGRKWRVISGEGRVERKRETTEKMEARRGDGVVREREGARPPPDDGYRDSRDM